MSRQRRTPGGSPILINSNSESLPPELAPFLAKAQTQLAEATEGLKPDEAVHHLETTVAEAEAEASRLGIPLAAGVNVSPSGVTIADTDDGAVLVIRQMAEHN